MQGKANDSYLFSQDENVMSAQINILIYKKARHVDYDGLLRTEKFIFYSVSLNKTDFSFAAFTLSLFISLLTIFLSSV